MEVKIINKSHHPLPAYATPLSAGMDIRANLEEPVVIGPLERRLIPTGLYIALPEGYEAQMRPRSGLALKQGITLLNTPGTRWSSRHTAASSGNRSTRSTRPNGEKADSDTRENRLSNQAIQRLCETYS